jgi:hypothetical protein
MGLPFFGTILRLADGHQGSSRREIERNGAAGETKPPLSILGVRNGAGQRIEVGLDVQPSGIARAPAQMQEGDVGRLRCAVENGGRCLARLLVRRHGGIVDVRPIRGKRERVSTPVQRIEPQIVAGGVVEIGVRQRRGSGKRPQDDHRNRETSAAQWFHGIISGCLSSSTARPARGTRTKRMPRWRVKRTGR